MSLLRFRERIVTCWGHQSIQVLFLHALLQSHSFMANRSKKITIHQRIHPFYWDVLYQQVTAQSPPAPGPLWTLVHLPHPQHPILLKHPFGNVMPCLQSPKDTKVFPECGKGRLGQWQVYLLDEEYVQVSQLPTLTKTDTDKHDHSQRYTVPDKHTHIFCTNTHMQTCWQGTHRSCLIQIQCHYSHSSIHRHSHRCLFMQQIHLHTDITPRTFM
jgi:hypothetical protein